MSDTYKVDRFTDYPYSQRQDVELYRGCFDLDNETIEFETGLDEYKDSKSVLNANNINSISDTTEAMMAEWGTGVIDYLEDGLETFQSLINNLSSIRTWDNQTTSLYYKNQIVVKSVSDGAYYLCKKNCNGSIALPDSSESSNEYWVRLYIKGEPGDESWDLNYLGRFNWAENTYSPKDVVYVERNTEVDFYVCKQGVTYSGANDPQNDSTHWKLMFAIYKYKLLIEDEMPSSFNHPYNNIFAVKDSFSESTVESEAYSLTVPDNGISAKINKIGGKSRKSYNLITNGDIAWLSNSGGEVVEEGAYSLKAHCTGKSIYSGAYATNVVAVKQNTIYTISFDYFMSAGNTMQIEICGLGFSLSGTNGKHIKTFTSPSNPSSNIAFYGGADLTEKTITISNLMVEEGSVAHEFEPYFEGIVSSQTDAIQLRGRNLAEPIHPTTTIAGVKFTQIDGGYLVDGTPNGDATLRVDQLSFIDNLKAYNGRYSLSLVDENGNYIDGSIAAAILMEYPSYSSPMYTSYNNPFTATISTASAFVALRIKQKVSNMRLYIQLEQGSPTAYKPYSYNEIPTNLPILRSAGSVHDEIVDGKLIQRVGVVDLGTLNWSYLESQKRFDSYVINDMVYTNASGYKMLTCSKYTSGNGFWGDTTTKGDKLITANVRTLVLRDLDYTDATAFKNAMSGVLLHYELAEPIITDIELPEELVNAIAVEGKGTITFEDEYKLSIPNEVTYTLQLDEDTNLVKVVDAEHSINVANPKWLDITTIMEQVELDGAPSNLKIKQLVADYNL